MQELTDITKKVYDVLKENGIAKNEILQTLYKISNELECELWEKIIISPMMLNSLKDIVWYNLEHVEQNGENIGISNLRHLGTLFPYFIYTANDSQLLSHEYVKELYNEINKIIAAWDSKWKLVTLFTKSSMGWHGGDNPSKVIIYDGKTESPAKYGYNQTYGSILGSNGRQIKKNDEGIVLCALETNIGEYVNGTILYNTLIQLREACKKAVVNSKDVLIEYE